jgi:hypothetical protein
MNTFKTDPGIRGLYATAKFAANGSLYGEPEYFNYTDFVAKNPLDPEEVLRTKICEQITKGWSANQLTLSIVTSKTYDETLALVKSTFG